MIIWMDIHENYYLASSDVSQIEDEAARLG